MQLAGIFATQDQTRMCKKKKSFVEGNKSGVDESGGWEYNGRKEAAREATGIEVRVDRVEEPACRSSSREQRE